MKTRNHRVTSGNLTLTIYRWKHPATGALRWRFGWKDSAGKWRYATRTTLESAKAAAENLLAQKAAGGLVMSEISPARRRWLEAVHAAAAENDEAAVLEFLSARRASAEVSAVVAAFLAHKISEAGERTPHLTNVKRDLEKLAAAFSGQHMADIAPAALAAWWQTDTAGKARKTAKDLRASLIALWRWAVRFGHAPAGPSPAEMLPRYELGSAERKVITPAEMLGVLAEIREEFRAWAVLGAFAGLRPEEIAPPRKAGQSKARKRGLRCEDIDFEFGVIRVSEQTSKVGKPRIIPLLPACRSWLQWAGIFPGSTGPSCVRNPAECGETKRLGSLIFDGAWPQDAIRHSFGSYRNAVLRNLPQVAEEMGTSVAMLHSHYHNPQPASMGAEWFALSVPICSDKTGTINAELTA